MDDTTAPASSSSIPSRLVPLPVLMFLGVPRQIRVNSISAGPLGSRAAKAIGFIDDMIQYSYANAPIQKELAAIEVGAWFWTCRCSDI